MDAFYRQSFPQNYSVGYPTQSYAPQWGNTAPTNFGQVQGGMPIQQLLATLSAVLSATQQLYGGWQGFAAQPGYQNYGQIQGYGQPQPYQQTGYPYALGFTPYVAPTGWMPPGPGSPTGPIAPNRDPYSLLPAGHGSAH